MRQPHPSFKDYGTLFSDIDNGRTKIPRFQREFIWEKEKSAKLIDSMLKGFPIGTFILWKTKERMAHTKEVGGHPLPEPPDGDAIEYVLDGQQRITSLYAIHKGVSHEKDKKQVSYKDIYIDLNKPMDTDDQIVTIEKEEGEGENNRYISIYEILNASIETVIEKFNSGDKINKISKYTKILESYNFSTVTISDCPIEVACEIFTRINTGGVRLTTFQIMVAKTYDEEKNFDLAEKYDDLVNEHLAKANFETISESVIMQCVAIIFKDSITSKNILRISREDFIKHWEPMVESLSKAIDFIKTQFGIKVSRLLPYDSILVLFTYFFSKQKNKIPSQTQAELLEQFLYWVGLTERYSSGSETKIAEDVSKIKAILDEKYPQYPSQEIKINPEEIEEKFFRAGNSYSKTVLCVLSDQKPKTFTSNADVILDNNHLKIATSKNYHHFFPKGYLKKINKDAEPNLIANITIVNAQENLRIGKKPPSQYIKEFQQKNDKLSEALETHLISDLKKIGIENDDYKTFIKERSKIIANKLNKKLSPK